MGVVLWLGIAVVVATGAWFAARAYRKWYPRRLTANASVPLEGEQRRVVLGPSQDPYFALELAISFEQERPREPIALSAAALTALAPLLQAASSLLRARVASPPEPETKLVLSFWPTPAREIALGTGRASARSDRAFHAIAR